jgi:hypothetical protein
VEHSKNDSGGPQQLGYRGDGLPGHGGVKVIQGVPEQHGIERSGLILHVGPKEAGGASFGGGVERFTRSWIFAQTGLVFIEEVFPASQNVFGRDTEVALNKKVQSGLPGGSQVEQSATAEAFEIPKKFLQTI